MKNRSFLIVAMFACFVIATPAFSTSNSELETHCTSDEFAYLNAKMAKVHQQAKGGYSLEKNGKTLSICTGSASEPFSKVVYRYGAIGKVEMEQVATKEQKFNIYSLSTSSRTGEDLIFFSKEEYTYYVSNAIGQGSGVGLRVFKSGRQLANLFSGNEQNVDFESELVALNFEKASSPVLIRKKPADKFSF